MAKSRKSGELWGITETLCASEKHRIRRPGSKLTKDDITHYQRIVVVISEPIPLMKEIDYVIERNGGWPDAFSPG